METADIKRTQLLDQVKRIVLSQLQGTDASAYLFGSWARLEEKRSSDIDVAIEFQSNSDQNQHVIFQVRSLLEESTIPYKVDVIHLNAADEYIVQKVREEGIRWEEPASE